MTYRRKSLPHLLPHPKPQCSGVTEINKGAVFLPVSMCQCHAEHLILLSGWRDIASVRLPLTLKITTTVFTAFKLGLKINLDSTEVVLTRHFMHFPILNTDY